MIEMWKLPTKDLNSALNDKHDPCTIAIIWSKFD